MDGWTDIQTDGDYIKRVVHGPPGDHTLKNGPTHSSFTLRPRNFAYSLLACMKLISWVQHFTEQLDRLNIVLADLKKMSDKMLFVAVKSRV